MSQMINQNKIPPSIKTRLAQLPTESYCSYLWSGAAVGPGGEVMPCCRFFGPRTKNDDAPHIRDGLKQAREGEYFTGIRKQMLEGKKPLACKTCWDVEESGGRSKRVRDSVFDIDFD